MLLIPLKLPFLIAACLIWIKTDNEKFAAAAWGLCSFIIAFAMHGVTAAMPYYGIVAFLIAWGVFIGLTFLYNSVWYWPAAVLGAVVMMTFSP